MKKLLFIIVALSLLLSGNSYAQSILPATSVRTSDGSNVQLKLNALSSSSSTTTAEIALITAEIELIQNNLTTMEASLQALVLNDSTQEIEIATLTSEVDVLQVDLLALQNLVDSNMQWTTSEIAAITSEILLIQNNLGTLETRIDSNEAALLGHIHSTADAHTASALTYVDNQSIGAVTLQTALDTVAVWLKAHDLRLDSIELNVLSMIQPAIDLVTANIETLEALVISNYNSLYANLETHEIEITALNENAVTQEVRLVRATAAYENRYKKMILQYGYPIAINDLWDVNKAAAVYAMYDIVVFGDEYEKDTHEAHTDTVNIITRLKELKTDVEVFGYVAIGGELGANLDTTEIYLRIDEWLATGATGIFLDEFGYDYLVTRERQNMAVEYAHSKGMNIIANSWNIDWVFNNDDGYIEWEEFYGNPNLVAPSINADDYYLFENLFYYYEGGQKVSDQWRIYEVYRYYYDSATSTWGKNYYDQFGTKTLGLDGIQSTNANKDLYFINAYVGGRIINLDGYGASIELWGSSSTAYNHYNPSFFNNEASMFHRDKIQPTVSDYTGITYAQYDTKINGVTAKLIWQPGATASNPTLGTHKVQINGVDRTKTYVSSSATNTNTASTLVARDASGNFSAGIITATLTGNASTATKLAAPKNIAGTAFDGSLDIDISHNNLSNIGLRSHDDIDAAFNTIEIELSSISVAINNLDLRLDAIELILAAGISRVYIDGVALPTGEVEFVAGSGINLNISGSTVEIESTSTGTGATVEAILSQNYTARSQGTAEAGFYSIFDFDITSSIIVTGTVVPTINGLVQYETTHFTIGTWDDGGTDKLRITFASDVAADALVRVSCFTTLPNLIGATTVEDIGVYVSDNKIWDFSDLYELNTIALLRNGIYQKKALYSTSIEANKTRVTFVSAVNTTDEVIIIGTPSSLQSTEDIATYVSDNTIWDFTDDFDPLKVYIYRNGVYQKRSLFTTSVVSNKLRITFKNSINTTDEISLIYIQ